MTQSRTSKHQDVSINLFQRGNYSMLRMLTIINSAGVEGIPTRKLFDTIGTHGTYLQKVLDKAEELELVERIEGERGERGHFPIIHNIITDKGKALLQSQFM